MRRSLPSFLLVAVVVLCSTPAFAVVEYERICTSYGVGYVYVPGTDSC